MYQSLCNWHELAISTMPKTSLNCCFSKENNYCADNNEYKLCFEPGFMCFSIITSLNNISSVSRQTCAMIIMIEIIVSNESFICKI